MIELPLLRPWFRIGVDGDRVLLEYAHTVLVFDGRGATRLLLPLLALLDGTRTRGDLVDTLGMGTGEAVDEALALLEDRGVLLDAADEPAVRPALDNASFQSAGDPQRRAPHEIAATLAATGVVVLGGGAVAVEVARLLRAGGIGTVDRSRRPDELQRRPDLFVAAPASHELSELSHWNRSLLELRVPWLQLLPFDGRFAAVGPLFVPGDTCCYECYRLRRLANVFCRPEYDALAGAAAEYPLSPALLSALAGMAAHIAFAWLLHADPHLPGVMFALEWARTPAVSKHQVLRVPRCPACFSAGSPPALWFDDEPREVAGSW
jgi:bacteriocin biosynthesis cyclodehydratase domain-containing protein